MKQFAALGISCLTVLFLGAAVCGAQSVTTETKCFIRGARVVSEQYDPAARKGTVILSHPQGGEVEGIGFAPVDRFPIQMQARLMALAAAETVAYGKLAERLCGVSVKQ